MTYLHFIRTSMSDLFCQATPLLPSITWHQNVAVYWQGDSACAARPPASTSSIVGQYHRTGGITFGAAMYLWSCAGMCVWVREALLLSGTAGLGPCAVCSAWLQGPFLHRAPGHKADPGTEA